jgi:hypothetical protein
MLISAARAVSLRLANQRDAAEPEAPVLIRAAEPFDLATARAIADPSLDLDFPLKGPSAPSRSPTSRPPAPPMNWPASPASSPPS